MENSNPELVTYDSSTQKFTGLQEGDIIDVSITITKDKGDYILTQTIQGFRGTETVMNLTNLTSNGGAKRDAINTYSNDIYQIPKINKRKFKPVYNKTLSFRPKSRKINQENLLY